MGFYSAENHVSIRFRFIVNISKATLNTFYSFKITRVFWSFIQFASGLVCELLDVREGGALTVCLVSVAVTTECKLSTKKSARPFTARRGSSNLQQLAEMNRSHFLCLWNRRKTVKCSLVHLQKIDFYFWFVCFFFYIPFYSWPFLNTFNMVFVCVCDPFA